jgi:hypothetical protein
MKSRQRLFGWFLPLAFLTLTSSSVLFGQTPDPAATPSPVQTPPQTERAEAIVSKAIEVAGGTNYLNVRTVVGRGFFTPFQEGVPTVPSKFIDYINFPDKERTEFVQSGIKTIQTNFGETGWLYDGATKSLHDMKPPQVEDFKRSMKTSLENLLQGWWRKEGAKLSYAGRREAGLAKRNETVRLTYPNGFWIEYEFGARDGIPAKVIFKRTRTRADSDELEEFLEEDHFAKPITVAGITAAWVIDHFTNGVQTSRINYESMEYNQPLPDSLFSKPDNIKSLK